MNSNKLCINIINEFYIQQPWDLDSRETYTLKDLLLIKKGIKPSLFKYKLKKIPEYLTSVLLSECENRCTLCDRSDNRHLQIHHICPQGIGGTNDFWNLIVICASCHSIIHTALPNLEPLIWSGRARELEVFGKELLSARLYELICFNALLENNINEAALAAWRKSNL